MFNLTATILSKYNIGDSVYLFHDAETEYIVMEITKRSLPIQDGANNNRLIGIVNLVYYHIRDRRGNSTTVEEGFLK